MKGIFRKPTKNMRVSMKMDFQIRDFARKNNMGLTQASDELARMFEKMRRKQNLQREFKF